jgi:iron complex outermembrane receptor protein
MELVLERKSFINATASFQLRGQTGGAKDATGNIFNAYYNEQRAAEAGTNINSLFGNHQFNSSNTWVN